MRLIPSLSRRNRPNKYFHHSIESTFEETSRDAAGLLSRLHLYSTSTCRLLLACILADSGDQRHCERPTEAFACRAPCRIFTSRLFHIFDVLKPGTQSGWCCSAKSSPGSLKLAAGLRIASPKPVLGLACTAYLYCVALTARSIHSLLHSPAPASPNQERVCLHLPGHSLRSIASLTLPAPHAHR